MWGMSQRYHEEPFKILTKSRARDRLELPLGEDTRRDSRSIKVVVADDHPVVLHGLVTLLSDEMGFNVVAACEDGEAALGAILKHAPDVALLDLRMPKMTGLDLLGKVSGTRIVIITGFAADDDLIEAISRGVHGVILKDSGGSALITCLRKVVAGYRSVPSELLAQLQLTLAQADFVGQLLTLKEREVMRLVAKGLSNKSVTEYLKISTGTVKLHLHHIYRKIGVSRRLALMTLGLLPWRNSNEIQNRLWSNHTSRFRRWTCLTRRRHYPQVLMPASHLL
jgi:DNA-binding NarL/FixJ family response regulator